MKHPHVSNRPARSLSVPHPGLPPEQRKRIYIGEIVASATPLVVQTLLGSCVAVCLRDPATGVGGMNHILLPGRCDGARCGVNAMELLINAIMQKGGDRRRLAFVRDFLATERIALVAQRLGGTHAVQVHFRTDTGEAIVHSVNGSRLPSILSTEDAYRCGAANITAGDTVLF